MKKFNEKRTTFIHTAQLCLVSDAATAAASLLFHFNKLFICSDFMMVLLLPEGFTASASLCYARLLYLSCRISILCVQPACTSIFQSSIHSIFLFQSSIAYASTSCGPIYYLKMILFFTTYYACTLEESESKKKYMHIRTIPNPNITNFELL